MQAVQTWLEHIKDHAVWHGRFRGLLHILIGRKLIGLRGEVISSGITWRQLAEILRVIRWEKDAVKELGIEPSTLPPRDRVRFWYLAIQAAHVELPEAREQAESLRKDLLILGYQVE
jgi:hypothetical protein